MLLRTQGPTTKGCKGCQSYRHLYGRDSDQLRTYCCTGHRRDPELARPPERREPLDVVSTVVLHPGRWQDPPHCLIRRSSA